MSIYITHMYIYATQWKCYWLFPIFLFNIFLVTILQRPNMAITRYSQGINPFDPSLHCRLESYFLTLPFTSLYLLMASLRQTWKLCLALPTVLSNPVLGKWLNWWNAHQFKQLKCSPFPVLPSAAEGMPLKVFQEPAHGCEETVGARRSMLWHRSPISGSRAKAFSLRSQP